MHFNQSITSIESTYLQVFDAFICHCDASENPELQLGSLQVKAMAKGRPLGSMCRKLELQEIFENMERVHLAELEGAEADRQLAEQPLGYDLFFLVFQNNAIVTCHYLKSGLFTIIINLPPGIHGKIESKREKHCMKRCAR